MKLSLKCSYHIYTTAAVLQPTDFMMSFQMIIILISYTIEDGGVVGHTWMNSVNTTLFEKYVDS